MALYLEKARCYVVQALHEVPLTPGAVYFIDLDDVIIKSTTVFNADGPSGASGKAKWKTEHITHCHEGNITWFKHLLNAKDITVVYLTARPLELALETAGHLQLLELPMFPVIFDHRKGSALLNWLTDHKLLDRPTIFIDDLDQNIRSVQAAAPFVQCYRVSSVLYSKLRRRLNL
jgi:phosphatidate phosphatase APP1